MTSELARVTCAAPGCCAEFVPRRGGRKQAYCSRACARAARNARKSKAPPGVKACAVCGTGFAPATYSPREVYCTSGCRQSAGIARNNVKRRAKREAAGRSEREIADCMFYSARDRCRLDSSVPFSITRADVLDALRAANGTCSYRKRPFYLGGGRATWDSPTMDRIIPALGYVPGNIEIISKRANVLKSDSSPGELRTIADQMERRLSALSVAA